MSAAEGPGYGEVLWMRDIAATEDFESLKVYLWGPLLYCGLCALWQQKRPTSRAKGQGVKGCQKVENTAGTRFGGQGRRGNRRRDDKHSNCGRRKARKGRVSGWNAVIGRQ